VSGPRLCHLHALKLGIGAQDGHLDREGRARFAFALAPQGLERLGLDEQRPALQPAEVPDLFGAAQAGRQYLLHEFVTKAGAAPDRLAQPSG
jgi:hypothetical protein